MAISCSENCDRSYFNQSHYVVAKPFVLYFQGKLAFRTTMLTIRQLRTLYTDELKVKHLSSENREVFASIVTTVFKEFVDLADSRDKSSQDVKSSNDDTPEDLGAASPLRTILPQNGNCYPDAESPIKCPNAKNVQRIVDTSSDSDDDDVIRAVKETLGVRTRRRTQPKPAPVPSVAPISALNNLSIVGANASVAISPDSSHISPKVPSPSVSPGVSSSLSSNPASSVISESPLKDAPCDESINTSSNSAASAVCCAIPTVVFPVASADKAEAPCGGDASDSSDSEGKLMIAESPMSAESPRRPSSDGEGSARVGEHGVEPRRPPLSESKNVQNAASSPSEGSHQELALGIEEIIAHRRAISRAY